MNRLRCGVGLLCLVAAACSPKADIVITGGAVWTGLASGAPQAGAVAIARGKILAVGDSAAVARYVGAHTEVLRADGGLVLPGFTDGHTHFIDGGFQLASVDLRDARTPAEFVRRLKQFAATKRPGQWILGGDWDHTLWPGAPLPRHEWIDSVTPQNPVFVNRLDGHEALANAAAMRAAGITRQTPTPPGGEIVRDARIGEPVGIFKDQALDLIGRAIPAPSSEERDSALARALAHAESLGVTATAHMNASWADLASYRRLERAGRLTVRVAVYLPLEDWRAVADTVRRAGAGDDWVRIAGLKGFMDGSAGSRTAYFFEPYADSAGYYGLTQHSEADMARWIGSGDSAGLQVAVHAIGDRANAIVLGIYDSVARAHGPRDRRNRIEHAQHLRPADVPRFGQLGVIASMQPYHAIDDGRWVERRIGPVRIKTTYAFRTLLDTGAKLAFGSDWTVAPLDPILGVYAAVTRRTLDGKNPGGWVPEQKVTVGEALRAYTAANAYATFDERHRGVLAPGYDADVVVIDRNLFTLPPDSLDRARVRYTVAGGTVVYRRTP
ncbi:MAG TPA: amidohydrolase family protein [Gemmatimonadales bacterium]|nr:amidohydrolase family protein [Gemmatimonadales bacterium]